MDMFDVRPVELLSARGSLWMFLYSAGLIIRGNTSVPLLRNFRGPLTFDRRTVELQTACIICAVLVGLVVAAYFYIHNYLVRASRVFGT